MAYTPEEIIQFIMEEDVKFIRLAFCDIFGNQKNISIMPTEIDRAFETGIAIDASAIQGFGHLLHSDMFLHPDPSTISILPWRPEHGRVVRMFCTLSYPDGKPFLSDSRTVLINSIKKAQEAGYEFTFGSEIEFYLFKKDENGNKTDIPYDNATYMDIAPSDRGENVRREICLNLEQMGIQPESSHHEEGPGQNEIDFRFSDPLSAADNAITFKNVVNTAAFKNGLYADFSPKPLKNQSGNGMHINISVHKKNEKALDIEALHSVTEGILQKIEDITFFLNTTSASYERLGSAKAPKFISWSQQNRSQLIRVPAASGEYKRIELRSPDPCCNPYLAFALIIEAGLYGIKNNLKLRKEEDINFFEADSSVTKNFKTLPATLNQAKEKALKSDFVSSVIPKEIMDFLVK